MIGDQRLRLVAALVAVGCLSQVTHLPVAVAALCAALVLGWRRISLRRLIHLEAFVLVLLVMLPLTMPMLAMSILLLICPGPSRACSRAGRRLEALAHPKGRSAAEE